MAFLKLRMTAALGLMSAVCWLAAASVCLAQADQAFVQQVDESESLELRIKTSRIITTKFNIPQMQVSNPEVLKATPLGANKIQLYGKAPGISQLNLWTGKGQDSVRTIDVLVTNDPRELEALLRKQYPDSHIQVTPTNNQSAILSGFVDDPDHIQGMTQIATQYFPNIINNVSVAGGQQVLLHCKVMEVSRTKLRDLGFDFASITNAQQNAVTSGVGGILSGLSNQSQTPVSGFGPVAVRNFGAVGSGVQTSAFSIVGSSHTFFGFLTALEQSRLTKVLAEPTLVTVSGRPAYFTSGGAAPIVIPNGLGTPLINYRNFGTRLDFVPIVLGNGRIRLEVRPTVEEIDPSLAAPVNGGSVPGFRQRIVDTAVELEPGQTLALAGLIQTRSDRSGRRVPVLGNMPIVGALFRRETDQQNEVETLIVVTPQLAEPLDPCETPMGGPGLGTRPPTDWELYAKATMEMPVDHRTAHCPRGPAICPIRPMDINAGIPLGSEVITNPAAQPTPAMMPGQEPMMLPQEPPPTVRESVPAPAPNRGAQSRPQQRRPPSKAAQRPANNPRVAQVQQIQQVPQSPQLPSAQFQPTPPPGLIGPAGFESR